MRFILICIVLIAVLVSPALAHTGVGQTNSFASGISHPLFGADHIVAMLAVGLWAVLAGGRAIWVWPTSFIAAMLAGFAAGTLGLQIPFVEPAILTSIIILGLFVALAVKAPVWLGAAIAGLFAFFHGHAHGTEAAAGSLIPYAAGFAFATAGLHAVGITLGRFAEGSSGKVAIRAMGSLTVLGGVLAGIALIAG
jgi:urease accessory protein